MPVKKTILLAALAAAPFAANAGPIYGGFEFFASGSAIDTQGADGIDDAFDFVDLGLVSDLSLDNDQSVALINAPVTGTFADDFGTVAGFGSFGSLLVKDVAIGDDSDASWANNPFWELTVNNNGLSGTVTFTAESARSTDGSNPLDMKVEGFLSFNADQNCVSELCNDYDATEAVWSIASTGQNSLIAAPVPEPSTIVLLGLGLVGLGVARRRQA